MTGKGIKYIYLIFLAMLLLLSPSLYALTLDEAVKTALENNHRIKEQEALVGAEEGRVASRKSAFLPGATLSYSYLRQDNVISPFQTRESSVLSAELTYNLFNGLRDRRALQAEEARLDASRYQKKAVEADIILETKRAYIEVLRAEKNLGAAREAVGLLKRQTHDAGLYYREGLIARNDLLKVEVELASAKQDLIRAEGNLRVARSRLERTTGKNLADEALDEIARPSFVSYKETRLREMMLKNRSELKYLRALRQARMYGMEGIRGGYLPSLDASLTHDRYGDSYLPDGRDGLPGTQTRAMVVARWNIFDGLRKSNDIKAEEAEIRALKERLMDMEDELSLQFRTALENYRVAGERLGVSKKAVEQAEENYRITENRFRQRMATTTDLLDARFLLTRSRIENNNARYDIYLSKAEIDRVVERREVY